uniref:Uncharacterized protein n=1 Tax=Anguilla anguilla TaxID=7936 RepID=A0A0E9R246_ANGAN
MIVFFFKFGEFLLNITQKNKSLDSTPFIHVLTISVAGIYSGLCCVRIFS